MFETQISRALLVGFIFFLFFSGLMRKEGNMDWKEIGTFWFLFVAIVSIVVGLAKFIAAGS